MGLKSFLKHETKYLVPVDGGLTFCEQDLIEVLNNMPKPKKNSKVWYKGEWRSVKEVRKMMKDDFHNHED